MSRIWDAVKRAEQEKLERQSGQVNQNFERKVDAVVATAPATAPLPIPETANSAISPARILTWEQLLESCRKVEWKRDRKKKLFSGSKLGAAGIEQFRDVSSQLSQLRDQKEPGWKKMLVTGALPKEGKPCVVANLAQSLALEQQCKILLIDADLRHPGLDAAIGTARSPGLSDYLLGSGDEFSIVQQGSKQNLFFIPSGEAVADPEELLSNGRLGMLIKNLESLFDWIILNSPTAAPKSGIKLLANASDAVLVVMRSKSVTPAAIRKACEEFQSSSLIGVMVVDETGQSPIQLKNC